MANRPYPSFYIYLDKKGEYRWRYQAAGNHETLADSGEGYTTYRACRAGVEALQQSHDKEIWRSEAAAEKKKKTG